MVASLAYWYTPTFDEIGHLPSGLYHLAFARFEPYRVNPPLVRVAAALPVAVVGYDMDWFGNVNQPGSRSEFYFGAKFLRANWERHQLLFFLARLAVLPFSVMGAIGVFIVARMLYGQISSWIAVLLWCFNPIIIGYAALMTPDMATVTIGIWSTLAFVRWLDCGSWQRAAIAGVCLGLAQLVKTTWLLLVPIWAILWLHYACAIGRGGKTYIKQTALKLLMVNVIGLVVLNTGYLFEGSGQQLRDYVFVSHALGGKDGFPGNRFATGVVGGIPVPLPSNYVLGVDTQKRDFEGGHWSYLNGTWRHYGWWYYYLEAIVLKTPIPVFALAMLAVYDAIRIPNWRRMLTIELPFLLPGIAVLLFVSLQTGFNHHIRYVLPVLATIFWIGSRAAAAMDWKDMRSARGMFIAAMVISAVFSGIVSFPYSMSYFNAVIGGPKNGWKYLANSNVDWGQSLRFLASWQRKHPEVDHLVVVYRSPGFLPQYAGVSGEVYNPSAARIEAPEGIHMPAGWYAVSAAMLPEAGMKVFRDTTPIAFVADSYFIYHIEDTSTVTQP